MELKHRPTHDWIVARKIHAPDDDVPTQVISGVVRFKDRPPHHYAVVVAIGPGRAHPQTGHVNAPPCSVGDTIMVRKVAGDSENIEGTEYFWFEPNEVLAVIEAPSLVA